MKLNLFPSNSRMTTKRRRYVAITTAGILALTMGTVSATTHQGSATLSNGAQLTVSVDLPVSGTEYAVAPTGTSVDVPVSGAASIGIGAPDATIVYVLDLSGSTSLSGGACGTILACEKAFFVGLNNAAIADGSTANVGVVRFSDSSSIALGLTPPASAAVNPAINGGSPGGSTNCAAGLTSALSLVNASTNGTKIVVFASDGECNTGVNVSGPAGALAAAGAVVHSVAIGSGSSCTSNGGTGTLNSIARNGGACTAVLDPNNLPNIIQSLIGSTLTSLSISVDGNAATPISNAEITPGLPLPGAVAVTYATTVTGLTPGAHTICVTAAGSDVLGDSKTTTGCVTIQVVKLTATPPTATNELGSDNQHAVTATIAGDPSVISGRLVTFTVTGQNAGATGTCSPVTCTTDSAGQVTFTYSVPKADSSLGTDTIAVASSLGTPPVTVSIDLKKNWVDTTPPVVACRPSVNPNGKNIPGGTNEDGYYLLTATDSVTATSDIVILVNGLGRPGGSPFRSGDTMKYTQAANGSNPVSKTIGGPGSAVAAHIVSPGDATVTATDTSGNTATIVCLVPKPPK